MSFVYILNVQKFGANGNTIHLIKSAFTELKEAEEQCREMEEFYKDVPNYMVYITGPIPFYDYRRRDSA